MPTPRTTIETREGWLNRCIPVVLEEGTANNSSQAVAICSSMWREALKKRQSDE